MAAVNFGFGEQTGKENPDYKFWDFNTSKKISECGYAMAGYYCHIEDKSKLVKFCRSHSRKIADSAVQDTVLYLCAKFRDQETALRLLKNELAVVKPENPQSVMFSVSLEIWEEIVVIPFVLGCKRTNCPELCEHVKNSLLAFAENESVKSIIRCSFKIAEELVKRKFELCSDPSNLEIFL